MRGAETWSVKLGQKGFCYTGHTYLLFHFQAASCVRTSQSDNSAQLRRPHFKECLVVVWQQQLAMQVQCGMRKYRAHASRQGSDAECATASLSLVGM